MKTSSSRVRGGVSFKYWFQTWAAIWGKEERGGNEADEVGLGAFEDGVGAVVGGAAAVREDVWAVLGVDPRTEPVVDAGFLAMVRW
jgi:hypothetical protein